MLTLCLWIKNRTSLICTLIWCKDGDSCMCYHFCLWCWCEPHSSKSGPQWFPVSVGVCVFHNHLLLLARQMLCRPPLSSCKQQQQQPTSWQKQHNFISRSLNVPYFTNKPFFFFFLTTAAHQQFENARCSVCGWCSGELSFHNKSRTCYEATV